MLIVDDVPTNLDVLAQALESGGYNVGGYQRKNRPRSGAMPSLVLLDVMMPDMDGFRNLPA